MRGWTPEERARLDAFEAESRRTFPRPPPAPWEGTLATALADMSAALDSGDEGAMHDALSNFFDATDRVTYADLVRVEEAYLRNAGWVYEPKDPPFDDNWTHPDRPDRTYVHGHAVNSQKQSDRLYQRIGGK